MSEVDITATTLGIRVAVNVRRFVDGLPAGSEVTVVTVFNWFLTEYPETKRLTKPLSFKVSISSSLNTLCGKKVLWLEKPGRGYHPHVYRKGLKPLVEELDAEPVTDLVAAGEDAALVPVNSEQLSTALRAASIELEYRELWNESSPRADDVKKMIRTAGESLQQKP